MLDFNHPNVLNLLGVCFDTEQDLPLIILPYMANGDLKSFLQAKRRGTPKGQLPEVRKEGERERVCVCVCVYVLVWKCSWHGINWFPQLTHGVSASVTWC